MACRLDSGSSGSFESLSRFVFGGVWLRCALPGGVVGVSRLLSLFLTGCGCRGLGCLFDCVEFDGVIGGIGGLGVCCLFVICEGRCCCDVDSSSFGFFGMLS